MCPKRDLPQDGRRSSTLPPLYNKESVTEADNTAAQQMLDAKTKLYDEIKKAQAMLEERADAAFQAAVDKALQTFATVTDPAQQATAQNELINAEVIYNGGQGDITNLGQNMSFEDLTAQNGAETTGVGPTPTGWNAYAGGKQVVTAEDAKAAGFTAWYGDQQRLRGQCQGRQRGFRRLEPEHARIRNLADAHRTGERHLPH